jgi:phenylpropionate dioxygenase-like ring-hydroxylating dioxygenase large terminal subunit
VYSRGSSTLVPKERYTSTEFAELEHARLWPRVWQIACTVDHVAEPGDWFEHRTGRYSVVIVRGDDGELRAFQNVCRHRGNAILCGSGSGLTELRCPFHRWAWDLDGSLREVPSRAFFGRLDDDSLGLFTARAGVWGRLVFVSLDVDAPPLEEYLEGVSADAAWARLDEFRCTATTRTRVACNWKVVSDGFSETYHVQGIHPEMLGSIDDVNAPQRIWDLHSVSYQEYGVPSPRLGRHVSEQQVWDSFVVTQGGRMGPEFVEPAPMPEIPEGQSVRDVIADLLRAEHRRTFGVDLSWLDTAKMMHLSQYNLFPNATVLVWGEMINVLLGRPGPTPDSAELVTFLLHRATSADAPRTRPADIDVPNGDDLGLVLGADVGVLESMQRGLRQPGLTHLVVSGEECRILNLHRNLARFVDPAHAAL